MFTAVANAEDDDVIELANGQYNARKVIFIDKTLTIKAKHNQKASLTFERGTFFEILDGGNLSLDDLVIDDSNSSDYSGNTRVSTKKWGITENYRLLIKNSLIKNLDNPRSV
ncbi:MAG: DUF4957 domain-containing protein [Thalassotalea sp.]|nr:DUF4957 domain-containing protein [Thalassotalea sp.]